MRKLSIAAAIIAVSAALSGAARADTVWTGVIPQGASCDLYGTGSSEVLCMNRTGTSMLFRMVDSHGTVSIVSAPAGTRVLSTNWRTYGDSSYAKTTTGVIIFVKRQGSFEGAIVYVDDAALANVLPQ